MRPRSFSSHRRERYTGEKTRHEARKRCALIERGDASDARERGRTCAIDVALPRRVMRRRYHDILAARDDKRQCLEPAQVAHNPGVGDRPLAFRAGAALK